MNSGSQLAETRVAERSGASACPGCGRAALERFFQLGAVPVNCISLWPTRRGAMECSQGPIELGFCLGCGAISNLAFDINRLTYDGNYDNSLHFSPRFRQYADETAAYLVARYDLRGKDIIDVGCGNGEFLSMLCQRGENRGVGFDPSFIAGRADTAAGRGVTIVPEYYAEAHQAYPADIVICRQVLEHIPLPQPFLRGIRQALRQRSNAAVFFEVPNASFVFQHNGIWDIIYEHCFYYTAPAIARLFSACGFDVLSVRETFEGQYLCVEARPSASTTGSLPGEGDIGAERDAVRHFGEQYRARLTEWDAMLRRLTREDKRIALWGAGAKGAMFLNAFRHSAPLDYIVDVNPHKHGMHIPGTGQQVVSVQFLKNYQADVLLIMNANYRDEIALQLSGLGLSPELICI
jgi:SAM-dependent methyltransferase